MENLVIEATKYTPEIKTDVKEGEIKFYGLSYPENANDFYQPLYEWVHEYFKIENPPLKVNFYIYYFNTSTSKCFMNFLEILEENVKLGKEVTVNWYYSKDDEDGLDSGEKLFMEMDLNFQLIAVDKI